MNGSLDAFADTGETDTETRKGFLELIGRLLGRATAKGAMKRYDSKPP